METLLHFDSRWLIASLNRLSQDVLGFRLFERISMYTAANHYPVLVVTALLYLGVIHGLQAYLRKNAIDLRKNRLVNNYAFVHNVFMTAFSLYMFLDAMITLYEVGGLRSWEGYYSVGQPERLYAICDLFYWSKYLELIDTLILVCKNKELGFLHLFHHCTTASVSYHTRYQPLWMGVWTNGFIHVFMYAHFARPISFVRSTITTAQIIQFLFVLWSYNYWIVYYSKDLPYTETIWGNFCYFVYLLFFIKFFIENYVRPKKATTAPRVKKEQ